MPGENTTVTVVLTAVGTSGGAASVDTATVSGAIDINHDRAGGAEAQAAATVTRPQVSVLKSLSAGQASTVKLGDTVSYDLVLTNTGDTTLTQLPLEDAFDGSQLAFISAAPPASASGLSSANWTNVASPTALAPGDVTTVTATFLTLSAGNSIGDLATVAEGRDVHQDSVPTTTSANTVLSVFDPRALEVNKTSLPAPGTIDAPGSDHHLHPVLAQQR